MKTMLVIARRTFGRLSGQSTSVFAAVAFLAASGALFARALFSAEGTAVSVASVWAVSASYALPLLASLLTMRLWNGDGEQGDDEMDLVAPVPERKFAAGRFLGAYAAVALTVAVSLCVPVLVLPRCAPALASGLTVARLLPAFAALCAYALPLTAIGSLAAVAFRRPAPSAVASFALTCALPQALYRALVEWCPLVRARFAEMPLDSLVAGAADGSVSIGGVAVAAAVTVFAVFAASKAFAMRRFVGGGKAVLKASTLLSVASALLATALFAALAYRLDVRIGWPGGSREAGFSARTREILSSVTREVRITACLRRSSPGFVPVSRLLRSVVAESRTVAGADVTCDLVDPRWDSSAARLAQMGLGEGTVMFSSGRRRVVVSAKDIDEAACASAIQRLSMPMRSDRVLFTAGHGEPGVDDFGQDGASDAARALRQDGYRVESLFTATSSIPSDCSVLVVSGARVPFSSSELRDIEMFLAQGGHLLATVSGDGSAGLGPILEAHGVAVNRVESRVRTTDGSNVVVSEFADHAVSSQLVGTAVVLGPGAVWFGVGASAPGRGSGFSFTPLCMADGLAFAVAAEKGAYLKSDLAIRPARIVLIGDNSFLRNASLASRANANRDLLLNSVAWLDGIDASGSADIAGDVVAAHMDRGERIRFAAVSSLCVPAAAALFGMMCIAWKRRHP